MTLNDSSDKIASPLFAFKGSSSIRERLVHTRPKETPRRVVGTLWNLPPVVGHHPCGSCSVCPQTKHSTMVDIGTDRPWEQVHFTNCNSENLIYLLTCPCWTRYVGMTTRKVCIRMLEHKSSFSWRKTMTSLTKHFMERQHGEEEFQWTVLEKPLIPSHISNVSRYLFVKEQKWIYRLHTNITGLNDKISWVSL